MNKRAATLAAVFAAFSLTLAPAHADTKVVTGQIDGLSISDANRCTSIGMTLVIQRTEPSDQIEGVKFQAENLAGYDLSKQEDWDRAAKLTVEGAIAATKDASFTAVTNAEGRAEFSGLSMGVYLITATTPEGKYLQPIPFVVTLPTGSDHGWNCAPVINAKFEPVPVPPPTRPPFPPFTPPVTPLESPPITPENPRTPPPDEDLGIRKTPANEQKQEDAVLGISRKLASTGAAVIGVVGVAAVMLLLGILLLRRRKNNEQG